MSKLLLFYLFLLLAFALFPSSNAKKKKVQQNYYQLFGVEQNAEKNTIKKAYFKFAQQYHPDKNKSPEAQEKFMKLKYAYEVLMDDKKREIYDRLLTYGQVEFNEELYRVEDHRKPREDGSEEFEEAKEKKPQKEEEKEVRNLDWRSILTTLVLASLVSVLGGFGYHKYQQKVEEKKKRKEREIREKKREEREKKEQEKMEMMQKKRLEGKKLQEVKAKSFLEPEWSRLDDSQLDELLQTSDNLSPIPEEFPFSNEENGAQSLSQTTEKEEYPSEPSSVDKQANHWVCSPCRKSFKSEQQWKQHKRSKKHISMTKGL